ncbi:MAG: SGNH/GDSL hydrolase family protein [Chloroflexi bacterium]|nr:SGNH/GDSL hydrolase family protein [Chloroflexota bacterium]
MTPIFIAALAIGILLITLLVQRRAPALRRAAGGLLVTYFTLILLFGAGEVFFRCCFAQSENTVSKATLNWLDRNWRVNSLGFRDREWTSDMWTGKTTILVTGDSFTAGWGIDDPADRYTDVLASRLGSDYTVMNLGIYGTSTPEQLDLLESHPVQMPDVVIMQYFLNDINYTMLSQGVLPTPKPAPAWAEESYLLNFFYNRLIGRLIDPHYNRDWWSENYAAYDNAVLWDLHRAEIEAYIDHVDSVGARLIVVIFPNMLDPVRSIPYVDRVAQAIEATGHDEILKLFDAAAAWTPQERMVSPQDTHPSVAFHHFVGDLIAGQYFDAPGAS